MHLNCCEYNNQDKNSGRDNPTYFKLSHFLYPLLINLDATCNGWYKVQLKIERKLLNYVSIHLGMCLGCGLKILQNGEAI